MKRDVVSLNKVVVEVNWQHLRILNWLLGVLREVLVVDVVRCLLCFSVGVPCFRWVRVLRLFSLLVLGGAILGFGWRRLNSRNNSLLDLLLLNLLLLYLFLNHLLLLLQLLVVLLKLLSFKGLMLLEKKQLLLLSWIQGLKVLLLLKEVQSLLGLSEHVLLF